MRRLILAVAALAVVAAPTLAMAQQGGSRGDSRRDYRDDNRGGYQADRRSDDRRGDYRNDSRADRRSPPAYRAPAPRPPPQRWSRDNRDWWRGRPEFRGYAGARSGYWFAPSYGYVRVDPRFARHSWRRGDYVPAAYRGYYVIDPYFYGLRPPPRGYRWVHLDNHIALVAITNGLIVEMLMGVY